MTVRAWLLIVDNHRSTYKIIIPANPDKITGEDAIIIKYSPLITDPDGFIIQTAGNQLFITGGSHKGCIYGMQECRNEV